jgi:hypothetical protein
MNKITSLTEIRSVGITDVGDLDLTDDEILKSDFVCRIFTFFLYVFKRGDISYYFVRNNNEIIAWTIGYIFKYTTSGDDAFYAKRSYESPEQRGNVRIVY